MSAQWRTGYLSRCNLSLAWQHCFNLNYHWSLRLDFSDLNQLLLSLSTLATCIHQPQLIKHWQGDKVCESCAVAFSQWVSRWPYSKESSRPGSSPILSVSPHVPAYLLCHYPIKANLKPKALVSVFLFTCIWSDVFLCFCLRLFPTGLIGFLFMSNLQSKWILIKTPKWDFTVTQYWVSMTSTLSPTMTPP